MDSLFMKTYAEYFPMESSSLNREESEKARKFIFMEYFISRKRVMWIRFWKY